MAISSVWGRKRRLAGTALAAVIGVAFLVGTLVLGDTMRANFVRLFTDVSAGTDVVVRSAVDVNPSSVAEQRGPIDAAVVGRIRAVPGVASAEGQVVGYGSLIGADGKGIGGNGPPRQAGSWITDPALNPYRLVEGRAPAADDEVVINRGAAKLGRLRLGDPTTVLTPDPVQVKIVGIATFGAADGFGTATWTAFTLAGAQAHVTHQPGLVTSVLVRAVPGTSSATLRDRVAAALPEGLQAITGRQLANERIDQVSRSFLNMVRTFLVVFAAIALLVAALTIANTFSITLAQRTQELGLLRAVGASRRQVRLLVTGEALVVGLVGSVVGLLAGLGIAGLLKGLFDAAGGALPAGGLVIRPISMFVPLLVGVVITVVAAQLAARRAGRISPVSALHAGETTPSTVPMPRVVVGAVLLAGGLGLGVVASSAGMAGLAALALVAATLLLAPLVAGPVIGLLGAGLPRLRGQNARLAALNAQRDRRRTAATATALIVGVAIVSLFTVFAASLKKSSNRELTSGFKADLAVNTAAFGGGRLSPRLVDQLRGRPEVASAVAVGDGPALLDRSATAVTATDPAAISKVVNVDVVAGRLADVGDGLAVSRSAASSHRWRVGSVVAATFADGSSRPLKVRAIYRDNTVLGSVVVPSAVWAAHTPQATERTVFVTATPGISLGELRSTVKPLADQFGGTVQDRSQFASAATGGLDKLLAIVYVLLALVVLIALLGIANALSLAVHERRREIGLLRAVGQTRRQTRSVLRREAVLVSTFGTLMGLVLGAVSGAILFRAVSDSPGLTVPVGRLAIVAVLGAAAGALAARRPAKRAAKLPILDAITAP